MTTPRIYLDCTRVTVVISCRDCDHWAALRFTKLDGWECAAAHEARCHPDDTHARKAFDNALRRAAALV